MVVNPGDIVDTWPGIQLFLLSLLAFAGVSEFIAFSVGGFSIKKKLMSGIAVGAAAIALFGIIMR